MSDPVLADLARDLMILDIIPTLTAPRGLDLSTYAEAILKRFRNPEIRHLLAQIAWDGSQKLPFRILGTLTEALEAGHSVDRLAIPLAAWMRFVRLRAAAGEKIVDPLADKLVAVAATCSGEARADVAAFLTLDAMFSPSLVATPAFVAALEKAYVDLA
jgi:fructuronate reductase